MPSNFGGSIRRWWELKCAEARLRRAEAACRAMPYGHFYDVDVPDHIYYRAVVELDDARKAVMRLRDE